jgi:hypothetical protein
MSACAGTPDPAPGRSSSVTGAGQPLITALEVGTRISGKTGRTSGRSPVAQIINRLEGIWHPHPAARPQRPVRHLLVGPFADRPKEASGEERTAQCQ